VAAFRYDHRLGADRHRFVDDPESGFLLHLATPGQVAEIGTLEGIAAEGPVHAQAIEQFHGGCELVVEQQHVHHRGEHHVVRLLLVQRRFQPLGAKMLQRLFELLHAGPEHGAPAALFLFHGSEIVGDQAGIGQRVSADGDQAGDIDTHGADEGATATGGAGIEDQFLGLQEIIDGDVAREEAIEPAKRPDLPSVDAASQFELLRRGVFRVSRSATEMTGLGAEPTVHAGFQITGLLRLDALVEHLLGQRHPFFIGDGGRLRHGAQLLDLAEKLVKHFHVHGHFSLPPCRSARFVS